MKLGYRQIGVALGLAIAPTVAVHPRLTSDWLTLGKPLGQPPPDRHATAQRVLDTWLAQAKLRLPESAQETEKQRAEAETAISNWDWSIWKQHAQ